MAIRVGLKVPKTKLWKMKKMKKTQNGSILTLKKKSQLLSEGKSPTKLSFAFSLKSKKKDMDLVRTVEKIPTSKTKWTKCFSKN